MQLKFQNASFFQIMVLDIGLFREETGGNPQIVRDSQRSRYAKVQDVDAVIEKDKLWRMKRFNGDKLNGARNICSKAIGNKKKNKVGFLSHRLIVSV